MKTFKLDKNTEVICEWKKTRMAFKHVATLMINGYEEDSAKICYQNRTWEGFEFESVLNKLLDKTKVLTERKRTNFLKKFSRREEEEAKTSLKTIATIASLGNVFGEDQKQKNDWKARMLKAGLEGKGLIMPENWNELSEDEKEIRLNGAIEAMGREKI